MANLVVVENQNYSRSGIVQNFELIPDRNEFFVGSEPWVLVSYPEIRLIENPFESRKRIVYRYSVYFD